MKSAEQIVALTRNLIAWICICTMLIASCPALPAMAQTPAVPLGVQADIQPRKGSTKLVRIEPRVTFSASPSDLDIQTARVFTEPLIPMTGNSSPAENAALAQRLTAFKEKKNAEDISDLSQFIAAYPNSKWRPSLELCMGTLSRESGFTSNALTYFRSAWDRSKNETGEQQKNVADKAFAEYMMMLTRLGRGEELQTRIESVKGRAFRGAQEAHVNVAKQAINCFKYKPEMAFKCGVYSINSILYKSAKHTAHHPLLNKYPSTAKGTNLAELKTLAAKVGLKYQMAKRSPGAVFLVPSIAHWKTNHFSAIIRKNKEKYHVKDPTFDFAGNAWITAKALEAESDGYFLVPEGPLPAGWHAVTNAEAAKVWGKGGSHHQQPPGPNQPQTCTATCKDCPPVLMPQANAYTMQATLHIADIPVTYSAPIGPSMDFLLNYNHLEAGQPTNFSFANVGQAWSLNWLSNLTVDSSGNVSVSVRGGGFEFYPFVQPDNVNNPYAPNLNSQAILTVTQGSSVYTRNLPDGSSEVYGQPDGTGRYLMTQVVDAQGNATNIQYDVNFRVTSIVDAIGQASTLTYVSNTVGIPDYYKVSQISDPFSRVASIIYDGYSGSIASITDAISLKTDFTYDSSSSFINLMMTPYGSTSFKNYIFETPSDLAQGLRTQLPDGSATVIENWMRDTDQTYFWDREQLELYPNDPGNKDYSHCSKTAFMILEAGNDESPVPLWRKNPLESQVDFSYEGQSGGFVGVSNKPITVSRTVETAGGGTASQTSQYQYNAFGRTTQSIDPIGRTFQYKYAANNIDLLEVRQTRSGANDLIGKWIYNSQHRPTQYIDGSGQKTTYAYNPQGQLTSTTDAAGNTTTMTYDANKRLTEIDGPMPGTADKTTFAWYGFGQVQTVTDSTGYTLAFQYDAMNRPLLTTYPDTTTEQTIYDKLDAVLMKDRNGRWTQRVYDSLDRLVAETDPLGRKTQYTWCNCGSLKTLKDANNNTTTWNHDLQGRVIQKVYADSTDIDYVYQPNSGRLSTRTDALNQVTTYSYNLDNTLSGVGYTNEVNPTSDVALTYDQNYQRTETVQNGWGANSYSYNPYIVDPFKVAHFWVAGKPTVGDLVNVTVSNATLSGGKRNVQYTVVSGDTSVDVLAGHIKDAINADSALNTANIKSSVASSYVSMTAPSAIGAVTVKTSTNGLVTETIGGTATASNTVNITVKDAALAGGQKTKSYSVASGDTPTIIATGLKNAINADSDLSVAGITATSSAAVVSITSTSANGTTYSESVNPGGTETITHRGGPGETATPGGGGRLQMVSNNVIANSAISYSYDVLGRTQNRSIDGANNSINWGYDEMSRVTSEANLLGTFGYNYVDNTSGSSKGVTRLTSINYPNNQVTNFDWYNNNGDERLKQIQNLGPTGNVLSQFNYRYNPAGEITQWPQIQNGLSRFQQLGYDLAGQLTTSQISDAQPSNKYLNQDYYAYDPGANRTGNQTNQVQTIKLGGTVTSGDVLTVTVKDTGLSGGQQAVNYTVQSGDSLTTIAENLAANITLDSNLQTLGVNASSSTGTISVKSVSPNISTYAASTSGGATETLAVGTTQNFVENATIAPKPGQSITTGDVLKLTVRDVGLGGGPVEVSYTVTGGDTLASIATGLKNAINANSTLSSLGVTATSASATVTIKSTSANPTIYNDTTVATAKEFIDLNVCPNGIIQLGASGTKTTGDTLSLSVIDAGLAGGSKTVNFTAEAGDDLGGTMIKFGNAIQNDSALQAIGITVPVKSIVLTIASNSPNATTYRVSTNANATEILKIGLPPNGTQTAVIGGTKTTGNVLTITVYDAGLAGGSKAINYTVQSGDTLTTMTTGLANAITADSSLAAIGVSATGVSTVLNIKSTSQNATTYTSSLSGGATATISLAKTIGAQLSAYNNVNELTSIAAGGPIRFQASTNKALKTASVNSNPATLVTTKNFVRDESLASGASAASVAATDGANNTKTNTYQVNVNPVSTQNLTYDANGNMTSDGTNTYKWDAENRLIEIDYPGSGNKSEFVYDGRGRRVGIIETNSGTPDPAKQYIFSGRVRCEERQSGSNGFFYRFGETKASATSYYSRDQVNSVRELTDQTGAVTGDYGYSNFGIATKLSGSADSSYQFAGFFVHARSKLLLSDSRPYIANLARWLSRDSNEVDGPNLFAYVDNNPALLIDPVGMSASSSAAGSSSAGNPHDESDEALPTAGGGGGGPPPPDPNKNKNDDDKDSSCKNKDQVGDPCPPILEKINESLKTLNYLWDSVQTNPDNIPVVPPARSKRSGTVWGHLGKYANEQRHLKKLIERWKAEKCGAVRPEWEFWANRAQPKPK